MFDRKRYPPDWKEISNRIRFVRAGGRCEGCTLYPDCRAEHGKPHPVTGSRVVLTTAHLGIPYPDGRPGNPHDKMDVRDENLRALCQRCHLAIDRADHVAAAQQTRRRKRLERMRAMGQLELIP
jgi:hypothetical protein